MLYLLLYYPAKSRESLNWTQPCNLLLVYEALTTGDWSPLQGTNYKAVEDELWVMGQLVMRGNRVVMPEKLCSKTIMLAHEEHKGVVRMKS